MRELEDARYKAIGARIRDVRIEKNMSQAELAEKAFISVPHMSEVENGKTKLRLSTFVYITEALQVSADVLLRPNTPKVNGIYQGEFKDLLTDCSPAEIDSIIKIVKELKTTMRMKKDDYNGDLVRFFRVLQRNENLERLIGRLFLSFNSEQIFRANKALLAEVPNILDDLT